VQKTLLELLKLQSADVRMQRLRKDIEEIPARKERARLRQRAREEAFAQGEALWKQESVRVKELEIEIETIRDNVRRYRQQQFEVKTNEGYRTLLHEIEVAEASIREKEDRTLELMESVERHRDAMNQRRREADEETAQVEQEIRELDETMARLDAEVTAAEGERAEMATGVESSWLARYDRIIAHVGDAAIVPVDHGTCGGCHMKLPPQTVHDARRGDSIANCTYCGRMLYWKD